MGLFAIMSILIFSSLSWAAISKEDKKIQSSFQSHWISHSGSIRGGVAGMGFSLVDAKSIYDKKQKIERVILDIGDYKGGILRSLPGYYQAEIKEDRLFIDFSQMAFGKVNLNQLRNKLKNLKFVTDIQMTLDPEDKSLNLAFSLKQNTKIRVFQVAGVKSTSKVVIDFSKQ